MQLLSQTVDYVTVKCKDKRILTFDKLDTPIMIKYICIYHTYFSSISDPANALYNVSQIDTYFQCGRPVLMPMTE